MATGSPPNGAPPTCCSGGAGGAYCSGVENWNAAGAGLAAVIASGYAPPPAPSGALPLLPPVLLWRLPQSPQNLAPAELRLPHAVQCADTAETEGANGRAGKPGGVDGVDGAGGASTGAAACCGKYAGECILWRTDSRGCFGRYPDRRWF